MAGDLRSNRNELIKLVSDFWENAAVGIVGLPGPYTKLVIADVDNDSNPDEVSAEAAKNQKPFARLRIQHAQSGPRSISGRRYRNDGGITVNLFIPRQRTSAWTRAGLLADALILALRQHRGSVQLTGVTPRERPINNGFSQIDVVSDFYWEQFVPQPGAK